MPRGLLYEIKCIEQTINGKKSRGEDIKFEQELVKEYKRYLEGGDKHDLWLGNTYSDGGISPVINTQAF